MDLSHFQGQILIGTFFTTALWGMQFVQTLTYFNTYDADKWYLKTLVATLCVLDTVHEALCVKASWTMFIPNFGSIIDPMAAIFPPELLYQIIVTSAVVILAHSFFVWRIWRFTRNRIFLVITIPPTIGQVVCSILYTARAMGETENILSSPYMLRLALCIDSTEVMVATFIAVVMSVLLRKNRTGFYRTDQMIQYLIYLSVGYAACIAIFGIVGFIFLLRWPSYLFVWVVQIPSCALYCNVVLASLNTRKYIGSTVAMFGPFSRETITVPSLEFYTTPHNVPLDIFTSDGGTDDGSSNVRFR